jgi:hypothetical protein
MRLHEGSRCLFARANQRWRKSRYPVWRHMLRDPSRGTETHLAVEKELTYIVSSAAANQTCLPARYQRQRGKSLNVYHRATSHSPWHRHDVALFRCWRLHREYRPDEMIRYLMFEAAHSLDCKRTVPSISSSSSRCARPSAVGLYHPPTLYCRKPRRAQSLPTSLS